MSLYIMRDNKYFQYPGVEIDLNTKKTTIVSLHFF